MLKLAAVAFALLTLLSEAALAQEYRDDVCPVKPPAGKRAERWAGRWFAKGEQAAKETRFQEALDAFLCSLHLRPHQNTVFNVAQLTNLVEDKASATASIKKFREEHPNGEFDDELSDLLASLEKAQGIAPSEAPVAEPTAPEPAPTADPADEGTAATESNAKNGMTLRTTGVVAIAASGATLVVGIVLAAMAGASKKDAEGASDYDAFRASEDDMKGRQTGAAAMFVVTGVLAGTGALMFAVGRRGKEPGGGDGAQVDVTPGPVGLSITGRF